MLKKLFEKYRSIISYVFFGALTTLINTLIYVLLHELFGISNIISNLSAWLFAVAFAFITNKIWVFESKEFSVSKLKSEGIKFLGCRVGTGLLDMLIMYIGVDLLTGNSLLYKLISNAVVIISNYIASRVFIFRE